MNAAGLSAYTIRLKKEKKWWVATCREVEVASQGRTKATALSNLVEALELHFQHPMPTTRRQARK